MNAWDVFWFLFVFIPLGILWVLVFVDLMGRRDLLGWQKAIWAMVVIFFPWIGIFAYFLTRPREAVWPAFATGATEPTPAPRATAPQPSPRVPPPQPTGEMPTAQA